MGEGHEHADGGCKITRFGKFLVRNFYYFPSTLLLRTSTAAVPDTKVYQASGCAAGLFTHCASIREKEWVWGWGGT